MANFTANYALDYKKLDLYKGYETAQFVASSTDPSHEFYVYLQNSPVAVTVDGDGFKYTNDGIPYAGKTTSAALFYLVGDTYKPAYLLDDVSIDMSDAAKYIFDPKYTDPQKVAAEIFGGDDYFYGSKYADKINGYDGIDHLKGGGGKDQFFFVTKPDAGNYDYVTDFGHGSDKIALSKSVFGLDHLPKGKTFKDVFHDITKEAEVRTDRIVYDKDTGKLSWDKDGSGSQKPVTIAIFEDAHHKHPTIDWHDFILV